MRKEQEIMAKEILLMHLNSELDLSKDLLTNDHEVLQQIASYRQYSEDNAYKFYMNQVNEYFTRIWQHRSQITDLQYQEVIPEMMNHRVDNIYNQVLQARIKIVPKNYLSPFDYSQQNKEYKLQNLKSESESIKNKINEINQQLDHNNTSNQTSRLKDTKNIYEHLYSQGKIKEAEQYAKKKREEQLERQKKLIELRKKEEETQKQRQLEEKSRQESLLKSQKEKRLKKIEEYHEKREKEKQLRDKYKTQYIKVKKSLQEKPPLFQKINENYSKRYEQAEKEKRKKLQEEKKDHLTGINQEEILKHERQYEEMLKQRQKERRDRIQLMNEEEKSRVKYHSSFELGHKQRKQPDPKELQKEHAKSYRQKIQQYKSLVKQKYKPKLDKSKQKQLLTLIEQMELNQKRVKKTKLDNGAIIVEQLKKVDPKMIGMEYLELTKEIAAKSKARRRDDHANISSATADQRKPINYLQQLRKNRTRSQKMNYIDNKRISYDEKVKRVLQESEKISEHAKQNEMMLKFGKFKTSEEILACKDEIDQNYIDMVNLKLKLILNQSQQNEDDQT